MAIKINNHDCNTCSYSVFNGNDTCPAVQAVNKPINYSSNIQLIDYCGD